MRARMRLSELQVSEFGQSVLRMVSTRPRSGHYLDRLVLKSVGATHFVRTIDIDWIEGAGVCVRPRAVAGR